MRYVPEPGTPEFDSWQQAEFEANWFAASFLMPTEPFKEWWKAYNGNVLRMSEKFDVSPTNIIARARSLELLPKE